MPAIMMHHLPGRASNFKYTADLRTSSNACKSVNLLCEYAYDDNSLFRVAAGPVQARKPTSPAFAADPEAQGYRSVPQVEQPGISILAWAIQGFLAAALQ